MKSPFFEAFNGSSFSLDEFAKAVNAVSLLLECFCKPSQCFEGTCTVVSYAVASHSFVPVERISVSVRFPV